MLALALHDASQLSEKLDPLMSFQPSPSVGEEPVSGIDFPVERRLIVAVEPSERRSIESLNDLDHDYPPSAIGVVLRSTVIEPPPRRITRRHRDHRRGG
jgi:hypothetical protein